MEYNLKFYKTRRFWKCVKKTISQYGEILRKIDLKKFNKNIIRILLNYYLINV